MNGQTMTREAELSWHLHRAALPYLRADWPAAQRTMRANLTRFKQTRRAPLAESWVDEWWQAVEEGPDAVESVAMMPGERGNDLRQMSPLAGLLPQDVRMQVIRELRSVASR